MHMVKERAHVRHSQGMLRRTSVCPAVTTGDMIQGNHHIDAVRDSICSPGLLWPGKVLSRSERMRWRKKTGASRELFELWREKG